MGKRQDIILAVKQILDDTKLFNKVYTEPTDIEKERSYPIAWISLGAENILDGDISSTCYLRSINLNIDIKRPKSHIVDGTRRIYCIIKSS